MTWWGWMALGWALGGLTMWAYLRLAGLIRTREEWRVARLRPMLARAIWRHQEERRRRRDPWASEE